MSRLCRFLAPVALLAVAALSVHAAGPGAKDRPRPKAKGPKVEVVFCLDTTGSMTGLIDGAKRKIWSVCNQIAGGKPTPDLKVGLVAYRDRGDAYVTKVFDLTDDLDAVHANLMKFVADGGGDEPESVNQALYDAVHKVKWSKDAKTLKLIFLVGDAPPHMDYPDDVKYPVTCKEAVRRGIVINAIQCGSGAECTRVWKDIAAKSEGSYAAIPQEGGVVAVATPYDKELAKLNAELAGSTLAYGGRKMREVARDKAAHAAGLPAPAAADRAGYAAKSGKGAAAGDLADDLKAKRVRLEELKEADLPEELKKLKTTKERKAYLDRLGKKRDEISKKVLELDRKRSAYIAAELKKKGKGKDSFDSNVLDMLRKQAKKHDLKY
jgi:hypothetical protein